MSWGNVLVVRSSNRAIEPQCAAGVDALVREGAVLVSQTGSADVALQRCVSLSRAVSLIRDGARPFDVVLMVDDDIVFGLRAAELVCAHARKTGVAASACYALADGALAFEALPSGRYMGGLGFLAIPAASLLALAARSNVFADEASGEEFWEFTTTGSERADNGRRRWMGEDLRLTRALGGVDLLPLAVGHLKGRVLLPERERFEALTGRSQLPPAPSEAPTRIDGPPSA